MAAHGGLNYLRYLAGRGRTALVLNAQQRNDA